MSYKTLKIMFFVLTLVTSADSFAGEKQITKPPTNQQDIINEMRTELLQLRAEITNRDNEAYRAQNEYTKKYYSYLSQKTDIYIEQFKWQRSASERLLWLVVTVVISGILFSGVQLWRASSTKDLGPESSIEIASSKIKITSSVVGLIVLVISIVFFYFFLTEVYTVKIVDMTSSETKPQALLQKEKLPL